MTGNAGERYCSIIFERMTLNVSWTHISTLQWTSTSSHVADTTASED
jgi:hypothetical protein